MTASNPSNPPGLPARFAAQRVKWSMTLLAAVAVALLVLMVGPMMLYAHYEAKAQEKKAMEP